MITIFCCPKPFDVYSNTLQLNAISSWLRLTPRPEVILCGNEYGTAEVCRSLALRHIPDISVTRNGVPYVSSLFDAGQSAASSEICCYINADIILRGNFIESVRITADRYKRFLIVGQRTNLDITEPIQFDDARALEELDTRARLSGRLGGPTGLDYFVFRRGLFSGLPPFCLGRFFWDNYLIWYAAERGATLIDATPSITAIHQNHEYRQHKNGYTGLVESEEYEANRQLFGDRRWPISIDDASCVLTGSRMRNRWLSVAAHRLHRHGRANRIYAASWDFLRSIGLGRSRQPGR